MDTNPALARAADPAARLLEGASGVRALVVGDVLLDAYRDARGVGACREAPAPKAELRKERAVLGGAGNVAANLGALGADVRLVSAAGDDADGDRIRAALVEAGITARVVTVAGRRSCVKERILVDGRLVVRVDRGDRGPIPDGARRALHEALGDLRGAADVLVLADYDHGVLDDAADLDGLARIRPGVRLLVDSARLGAWRELRPDAATPNVAEALALVGGGDGGRSARDPHRAVALRAPWLREATGADAVTVTLDAEGALVVTADGAVPVAGLPVRDAGAIGAGDVFTAVTALGLALGIGAVDAAGVACRAASAAVARPGTAVARRDDLAGPPAPALPATPAAWDALGARLRAEGGRVVLTNGCFDLIHAGHVELLERARDRGDVLVVALNDDPGVRRAKGPGRPVLRLAERARLLGALSCVDHVVAFGEDTACGVLRALRPDVYVKGLRDATAPPEAGTAREVGAAVDLLPATAPGSTREVIRRVGVVDR